MIQFLLKLILTHIIGDFVLQPSKWVNDKNAHSFKSKYLYYHIVVHSLLLLLFLNFNYIIAIIFIILSHLIIDIVKIEYNKRHKQYQRISFFIDQILHLLILFAITFIYFPNECIIIFKKIPSTKILLITTCLIFVTNVAAVVIKQIMSHWHIEDNLSENSLKNAGKYIGMLERLLIFFFIITNQPASVGFLVAAKSIFRFNDLSKDKDRKLTEYILIGTLLSFSIALIISWCYLYIEKYIFGELTENLKFRLFSRNQ